MGTDVYPPVVYITIVRKQGVDQPLPRYFNAICELYRSRPFATDHVLDIGVHKYCINKKLPEEWVNGLIVLDSQVLKVCSIENKYNSSYDGSPDHYAFIYLQAVDGQEMRDLAERERQTKEEVLVFADRLEDRGELTLANMLRENMRDRGLLLID